MSKNVDPGSSLPPFPESRAGSARGAPPLAFDHAPHAPRPSAGESAALAYPKRSSPAGPDVLAVFRKELARAAATPAFVPAGPALWPRFVRYYLDLARLPRKLRRALRRRWRRSLAAIALLLALGQAPALAATLPVDPGAAPGIAPDDSCSLIEAIENANDDDQTHADCPSGSGADTLVLPTSSTQTLTAVDNNTFGPTGLPVVRSAISIEGNGSTLMRDTGAEPFRIFAVNGTGVLTLNETTLSGGSIFLRGGGFAYNSGGGVYNNGTVTLTNSTVSGNSAPASGGGVYNTGTMTLMNSTVSGNSASIRGGGGVFNLGTMTLMNSTVSGNRSPYPGGGGVYNAGSMTLTNSTVSGNDVGTYLALGGGVANTGTLTLSRSLVSGNTGTSSNGAEIYTVGTGSIVIADDFNLFGHNGLTDAQAFAGFNPGANDLTATSDGTRPTALGAILNAALADNGGPTKTHALVAGSPAIDAVDTGCPPPEADQRGIIRPQGPNCDIGAFEGEISRAADLAVSLTDSPDPVTVNQPLTYTITVRNEGPSLARGVQVTDNLPEGVVLSFRPGACAGTTTVTCNLGPLASGAEATVTIGVIPTRPGTVSNPVIVLANDLDPNLANNSATATTAVREPLPENADLAITAAATPEPGASGQGLTYTLLVRNNGPQTATGVLLTDDFPDGVVLGGPAIPSQGVCQGTDPATCTLGTLPSGTEATVTIDVIPTAAGTLTNRATVNLNETDPDVANNAALTTTTVEPPVEPLRAQATCSTVRCALQLACNRAESLGDNCENNVTLFVSMVAERRSDALSARLSDALSARRPRSIRFATASTNIPPGGIERVRLKLTPRGERTAKNLIEQGRRKLQGVMEIRNTAGGTDTIRLTVRLR